MIERGRESSGQEDAGAGGGRAKVRRRRRRCKQEQLTEQAKASEVNPMATAIMEDGHDAGEKERRRKAQRIGEMLRWWLHWAALAAAPELHQSCTVAKVRDAVQLGVDRARRLDNRQSERHEMQSS